MRFHYSFILDYYSEFIKSFYQNKTLSEQTDKIEDIPSFEVFQKEFIGEIPKGCFYSESFVLSELNTSIEKAYENLKKNKRVKTQ